MQERTTDLVSKNAEYVLTIKLPDVKRNLQSRKRNSIRGGFSWNSVNVSEMKLM